jgi:hypothetical protein
LPLIGNYADNILSIFDSKANARVAGSDQDMRMGQMAAAFALFSISPVCGLGNGFISVMNNTNADIIGTESIWLQVVPAYGLIGIFAYLYFFYFSVIKLPTYYKSKPLLFISLAYWVTVSLTSLPGFLLYFYYLVVFVLIKKSKVYNNA